MSEWSDECERALTAIGLGGSQVRFIPREVVSSTMDVARELSDLPHFSESGAVAVVLARAQECGRGREGRRWMTDADGGLALTVAYRSAGIPGALPLVCGLTVAELMRELGVDARVKWPNDVVAVRDAAIVKLAGILCESVTEGPSSRVMIGVGVNVNTNSFPPEIPGASIAQLTGRAHDLPQVFAAVCRGVIGAIATVEREGFETLRERYEQLMVFRNRECQISSGGRSVAMEVLGVLPDGALRCRDAAGEHAVYTGSIVMPEGARYVD